MSGPRYRYVSSSAKKKPSIVVKLPFAFRAIEPTLQGLVNRLDATEEQMDRIEGSLARIEAALKLLVDVPEEPQT